MCRREMMSLGVLTVLLSSLGVSAQTPDELATRRKLLQSATTARNAGDHEKALSFATRAGRIHMTLSVQMFIAREQAVVGELSNAWVNAEVCAAGAKADPGLKQREEILEECNKVIDQLKNNAARVIVSMPSPSPNGAQVTVAGHIIPETLYEKPYVLSPGGISVEATAPGFTAFHRELFVGAGQETRVVVELQPLFEPTAESKAPAPAVPSASVARVSEPSTFRKVGPYATIGVGAASLGASVLFLVLRNSAINKLEALCTGPNKTICPNTGEAHSYQQTASTDNTLMTVTLVAGAAVITGGIVWLVYEKMQTPAEAPRAKLQIIPTPGGAVVGIAGNL